MTDRMRMETPDLTEKNIEKIAELFPNCITESKDEKGNLKKAINFDILKQMLSKEIVDGDEAYEFTWVGKKAAMLEANKPIRKTLRPCPEESLNWDTTQNLYIEGDNLDVLKLLQESYLGKVKMIYIDPPYNTGNDFIYKDDFAQSVDEYEAESGQTDEEGNKLFKNSETNGRFHSDWCSMMYSRLMVARNLLSEDGVIFISIDDNEKFNLKHLCDELFGNKNFIADIAVINNLKGRSDDKYIATSHESLLIYQKGDFITNGVVIPEEYDKEYKLQDEKGRYRLQGLRKRGDSSKREDRPNMFYPFYYDVKQNKLYTEIHENCIEITPHLSDGSDGRWRWGIETSKERIDELIAQKVKGRDEYDVFQKDYLPQEGKKRIKPKSFWSGSEFSAEAGTLELKEIIGKGIFDTPKPIGILKYILEQATNKDSIILDFFSGSATTAHAVMQLNTEDNGNRKFIMVQLQEPCDEKSEAYKAGFKNICEIGKERIRRAGKKILEEYSKSSKCEDALKPLLEEGNKRGGDRIRSLFSSLEQPSSQEDWIATQSATARNDGNSTGGSNTLSLNKVSSGSVTPQSAKADCSPQVEPLGITPQPSPTTNTLCPLDVGFRVFKLADSNMKDVYYSADEYSQQSLQDFVSNIKEDRTDLDLLFGCLLEWGLPLSMPYSSEKINSFNVHTYNDGDLIACFDENVSEEVIKIIAKRKPLRAVFRDSSFANSPSKINVTEIFKLLSPNTRVKVI